MTPTLTDFRGSNPFQRFPLLSSGKLNEMQIVLKGLHKTSKTLADGNKRDYYYAWKNGPAMKSDYGTTAFVAEFNEHHKKAKTPDEATVASLIFIFKKTELPKKSAATRRDYLRYIKMIEDEFGTMPLSAVEARGSRAEFLDWRNTMASNPRKADLAWSVLQRIFSLALDQERITRNPCEAGGRLAETGTRKDIIWTQADIDKFKASAPPHICDVFMVALWTGQRQGDILRLTWGNYDGKHIRLKQSKTGKNVTVKVAKDLKTILDAKRPAAIGGDTDKQVILKTDKGKNAWTSDGFRASWGKAVAKAKISGLTFHDLRGTFITLARRSGSSIEDIAEATGHSVVDVRSILEEHYLASDNKASDGVILKLERRNREQSSKPAPNRSRPQTKP